MKKEELYMLYYNKLRCENNDKSYYCLRKMIHIYNHSLIKHIDNKLVNT